MEFGEIAGKHQTDKTKYATAYNETFGEKRDEIQSLLEIGVAGGDSMRAWQEFFPGASLYGIDISPGQIRTPWPDATLIKSNQEDIERMEKIATAFGPWDVIIDDAGHNFGEQLSCAHVLMPHCKTYIIEDVTPEQNKYWLEMAFKTHKFTKSYVSENGGGEHFVIFERKSDE